MAGLDWLNNSVSALLAFPSGILATYCWETLKLRHKKKQNLISIVKPAPAQLLQDGRPMFPTNPASATCYPVTGKLGYLPENHQIWLLVQDPLTKKIWPQGFSMVAYSPSTGEWEGLIKAHGRHLTRIIAVVAPPSAQHTFAYYQQNGAKNGWQPIDVIPEECTNRASVDAKTP